jgi:hypothetical protein
VLIGWVVADIGGSYHTGGGVVRRRKRHFVIVTAKNWGSHGQERVNDPRAERTVVNRLDRISSRFSEESLA